MRLTGCSSWSGGTAPAAGDGDKDLEAPLESEPPPLSGSDASSFRRLNDEAVAHYDRWVPKLFPEAKRQASGG